MIICISLFFKKYNVSAAVNYVTIQNIAQYKNYDHIAISHNTHIIFFSVYLSIERSSWFLVS